MGKMSWSISSALEMLENLTKRSAYRVAQVNANMSIENMPVDDFTKEQQQRYIEGTLAVEDMAKETMAAFLALKNTN
jgi:hypothetical protein